MKKKKGWLRNREAQKKNIKWKTWLFLTNWYWSVTLRPAGTEKHHIVPWGQGSYLWPSDGRENCRFIKRDPTEGLSVWETTQNRMILWGKKNKKWKKSTHHHHTAIIWNILRVIQVSNTNQNHSRKGKNQEQAFSRHFAPVTKFTRTQLSDKFLQVLSKKRVLQQVNGLAKSKKEARGREGDGGAFQAGLPHPLKEWGCFIDQTGLDLNLKEADSNWQQRVCFSKSLAFFHPLSFHYLGTTPSHHPDHQQIPHFKYLLSDWKRKPCSHTPISVEENVKTISCHGSSPSHSAFTKLVTFSQYIWRISL